jgi:hypothetical protein
VRGNHERSASGAAVRSLAIALLVVSSGLAMTLGNTAATPPGSGQSHPGPKASDLPAIPGHYTIGLYADAQGTTRSLELQADQSEFDAFVGVTGDSARTFSACAFTLRLPEGVTLEGAIHWRNIPGLQHWGNPALEGVRVEYADSCQAQRGTAPVILGRVPMKAQPTFRGGHIEVAGHKRFGCAVELCVPGYPKPLADGLALTVERKRSLWRRLRDLF